MTARLLMRGAGFAGVLTAVGGGIVIAGALRPWYGVVAKVTMLGGASERRVASLAGLPGTWGGWAVVGLGLVVLALGVLLALDRTPARGRSIAIGAGLTILAVAVVATATVPEVDVIASATSEELLDVGRHLPVGVELELRAVATSGLWWVFAGAATAVVGAIGAHDG